MNARILRIVLHTILVMASAAVACGGETVSLSRIRSDEEQMLKGIWKKPTGRTTAHYAVTSDCGKDLVDLTARTMELLYLNMKDRFGFEGDADKVRVIVFSRENDFRDYAERFFLMKLPDMCIGAYSPRTKEIVAYNREDKNELTSTLLHEGTHQFIDLVTKSMPPLWVNEGIAVYFEASKWKGPKLDVGVVPKDRLKLLREAIRKDQCPVLQELITATPSGHLDLLGYSQAWSLVYFFANADGGRYAGRFRYFFRMLKNGTDGSKAFHEAFEKDFGPGGYDALEKRWEKFVMDEIQ